MRRESISTSRKLSAARPLRWFCGLPSQFARRWQTEFGNDFPIAAVGDVVEISTRLRAKWGHALLGACDGE